jgi:hypothetical protein
MSVRGRYLDTADLFLRLDQVIVIQNDRPYSSEVGARLPSRADWVRVRPMPFSANVKWGELKLSMKSASGIFTYRFCLMRVASGMILASIYSWAGRSTYRRTSVRF